MSDPKSSELKPPYHQTLSLENFTVFRKAEFEFVPGINVFVGENGTGKTHVMKAMYAFQVASVRAQEDFYRVLLGVFQLPEPSHRRTLNPLRRQGTMEGETAEVRGKYDAQTWKFSLNGEFSGELLASLKQRPVFIPAVEMMGHSKGFTEAYAEIEIDFDLVCRDIVTLLRLSHREKLETLETITRLKNLLGGDIEREEDGRFYLVTPLGRQPMPLVGEGLRKIATLVQLYENGWLTPGTTLFWDEPEVNLNPKWMDEVVAALLALSRGGVQIFLATHSYVILKELEVQAQKSDSFRYFAFSKSDEGTVIKPANSYLAITPNDIENHMAELYDRGIEKRLLDMEAKR